MAILQGQETGDVWEIGGTLIFSPPGTTEAGFTQSTSKPPAHFPAAKTKTYNVNNKQQAKRNTIRRKLQRYPSSF